MNTYLSLLYEVILEELVRGAGPCPMSDCVTSSVTENSCINIINKVIFYLIQLLSQNSLPFCGVFSSYQLLSTQLIFKTPKL